MLTIPRTFLTNPILSVEGVFLKFKSSETMSGADAENIYYKEPIKKP
jgi:hypothetical protein